MNSLSPLLGFNNNVRHRGRLFHIQTEDSGYKHPHVITHLFADGGRILKTVKTGYAEHLGSDQLPQIVRELMKRQHKAMFIALRDGEFDHLFPDDVGTPVSAPPASTISAPPAGGGPGTTPSNAPRVGVSGRLPMSLFALRAANRGASGGADSLGAPAVPSVPPGEPGGEPATVPSPAAPAPLAAVPPPPAAAPAPPAPAPPEAAPPPLAAVPPPPAAPSPAGPSPIAAASSPLAGEPADVWTATPPAVDGPPITAHAIGPSGAIATSDDARAASRLSRGTDAEVAGATALPAPAEVAGTAPPTAALPSAALDVPAAAAAANVPSASATAGSASDASPARPASNHDHPSSGRYVASRPATVFATSSPDVGGSIFGDEFVSEKSLDEVILSYLSQDLDVPPKK